MAAFNLPAMFDHVRGVTGQEHVHYVGHSQGTMIGFAGFSSNRTLAAMVKRFYALAPVAMVANIESPVKLLAPYSTDIGVSPSSLHPASSAHKTIRLRRTTEQERIYDTLFHWSARPSSRSY